MAFDWPIIHLFAYIYRRLYRWCTGGSAARRLQLPVRLLFSIPRFYNYDPKQNRRSIIHRFPKLIRDKASYSSSTVFLSELLSLVFSSFLFIPYYRFHSSSIVFVNLGLELPTHLITRSVGRFWRRFTNTIDEECIRSVGSSRRRFTNTIDEECRAYPPMPIQTGLPYSNILLTDFDQSGELVYNFRSGSKFKMVSKDRRNSGRIFFRK